MTNTDKLASAAGTRHYANVTDRKGTDKEQAGTCFLMLEPKSLCDSGRIARRLVRCKGVREVHLTSGKYGFVLSAETGEALKEVASEIEKLDDIRSAYIAVSHLVYRPAPVTTKKNLVRTADRSLQKRVL